MTKYRRLTALIAGTLALGTVPGVLFASTSSVPPATARPLPTPAAERADAVLDRAMERMGGEAALRDVRRVRLEMITQWLRTTFSDRPGADVPSYEINTELRDYTVPAWRNARRFPTFPSAGDLVDVVSDSVAIRQSTVGIPKGAASAAAPAGAWVPLNIAYVDERRELFAVAPERVLLLAKDAADRRVLADTTVDGVRHARVSATIDGRFPSVLFIRSSDGVLSMVRYHAAHPNDFGLAPWGAMDVETWYSKWVRTESGLVYPRQWDVRRVGRPYKRMTIVSVAVNPPEADGEFAVSDSLRSAFVATASRPMHDLPLTAATRPVERVVAFNSPGGPVGAVRLGARWLLLEGGQAPLNAERAAGWLRTETKGAVAGAILSATTPTNGGAAWLAQQGVPLYVAPGGTAQTRMILRDHGAPARSLRSVTGGQWVGVDGDSLRLEPVDLPNSVGALVAWVPSLGWLYSASAADPVDRDALLAWATARGWPVEWVGSPRGLWTAARPASAAR